MSGTDREVRFCFLAQPTDVNFGGKVHGGMVMKWIDQAGYACAVGWSGIYCVTVAVGGIRFVNPILIGDLVTVHCQLIYTGNTSMHFAVDVIARALKKNVRDRYQELNTMRREIARVRDRLDRDELQTITHVSAPIELDAGRPGSSKDSDRTTTLTKKVKAASEALSAGDVTTALKHAEGRRRRPAVHLFRRDRALAGRVHPVAQRAVNILHRFER